MFVVMTTLFIIMFLVVSVTYMMIKKVTVRQLGLGAQDVAVAVSLLISEDIESYLDFIVTRNVNSEYYRRMQRNFTQIKKQNNIKFIFTSNRIDDLHTEIILDSEPIGSEDYSAPGDMEEKNALTLHVFDTKKPVILPPKEVSFGVLLGSCAPIIDGNNEVRGVVGVSIDSGKVFSIMNNWFYVLIVICLLLLGVVGFLLSKVSVLLLDPLLKDKLTGAYNKRYSDTLLQKCIDNALKSNHDFSVMMMDLDHFKKVNDTYGHSFGDVVLSYTSQAIQSCLRKDDFLIRYGGEEFLVLFFNLDNKVAMDVAERIRKKIEGSEIYNEKENKSIRITISIGVTSLMRQNLTGKELISNADTALYKAKQTRNAVASV
jgi:diguanylate cyclase (GGDEF)-like protein